MKNTIQLNSIVAKKKSGYHEFHWLHILAQNIDLILSIMPKYW